MTDNKVLYNEDELKTYFDTIKSKFDKIDKYEKRSSWLVLIFILTASGIIPAIVLYNIIEFLFTGQFSNNGQIKPFIFLVLWIICAGIICYPLYNLRKKIKKLLITSENRKIDTLFYYVFSAYQNIKEYLKSKDDDYLKIASKYLTNYEFDELEKNVESVENIPGFKKEWISRIKNIIEINKKQVVPRLAKGLDVINLKPVVGNIAQFLYSQKQEDIQLQQNLYEDSTRRINQMQPYIEIKKINIQNIRNLIDRTYQSKNPLIRVISFSISIAIIYIIIIGISSLLFTKFNPYAETVIAGLLATSIAGGIAIVNVIKK